MEHRFDIDSEFSHCRGVTYLDHAGATLYSQSQLRECFNDLSSTLYGNPHSRNPSSSSSTETIDQVRELVLDHFNTNSDNYRVIFTSGCTHSLKLLGELFPWGGHPCAGSDHVPFTENSVMYVTGGNVDELNGINGRNVFCYLEDNHTSVLGLREIAADNGAQLVCITESAIVRGTSLASKGSSTSPSTPVYHLFAYPAQSNFSGRKYPLDWTKRGLMFHNVNGVWLILLDAASYAGTNSLDLTGYPAHFVSLSFYKIFGYPTGLGALLVRRDIEHVLDKSYFGGGTVISSIGRMRYHRPRPELHERFEDGTVSFLSIAALRHGFQTLQRFNLTMDRISQHVHHLTNLTYHQLESLKHTNGQPLCVIYCTGNVNDINQQGGILSFNLIRADGSPIGYSEVDKMAVVNGIHLRTGCFCNPGACQVALGLSSDQLIDNLKAGHSCGDSIDILNGLPTGCVRISFGYMSHIRDVEVFVDFLTNCFLNNSTTLPTIVSSSVSTAVPTTVSSSVPSSVPTTVPSGVPTTVPFGVHTSELTTGLFTRALTTHVPGKDSNYVIKVGAPVIVKPDNVKYLLKQLIIYPIKSCAGYLVQEWPLSDSGLFWDRQWMIVNNRGACLTQKQEPKLALIKPIINPTTLQLTLTCHNQPPLIIQSLGRTSNYYCKSKICGESIRGNDCGDEAAVWLSTALSRQCRLIEMDRSVNRQMKISSGNNMLSLSNEAQYLLVNYSSLHYLHDVLADKLGSENTPSLTDLCLRFRPNFVVECAKNGGRPFAEDNWDHIAINNAAFQVCGGCTRCHMICVDQLTGAKTNEPLRTLLAMRGSKVCQSVFCFGLL